MINKWMVKINGEEIYNTRSPPKKREKKRRREIKRKTVVILTTPESFRS